MRRITSLLLLLISTLATCPSFADDDDGYAITRPVRGHHWAILVGINYTSRQDELREADDAASQKALPALANAANDAMSIAELLTQYYSYDDRPRHCADGCQR